MDGDREAAGVLYDMLPSDEQLLVRTMHSTIPALAAGVGVTSGWFD